MLTLLGTSHIARQSLTEVRKAIEEDKPDIIALELDRGRLESLLNPQKQKIRLRDMARVGVKGWLFAQLGAWAEKKLGKHVGVAPGAEMLIAVRLAREKKIPIALIDQDISVTLKRFSNALTWREKGRFVWDVLSGMVSRKKPDFDLRTVPAQDVLDRLIKQVKVRYPNVYRVLVTERNQVMAKRLHTLLRANPDKHILAIVGAGHVEEMEDLLHKTI
ncbi:TraB/GumN family protein [Candidatus Woesearchaeota archaeon]|nr:TraB/GumN family protein [Candidatus Woesearchaeota archaeon]